MAETDLDRRFEPCLFKNENFFNYQPTTLTFKIQAEPTFAFALKYVTYEMLISDCIINSTSSFSS